MCELQTSAFDIIIFYLPTYICFSMKTHDFDQTKILWYVHHNGTLSMISFYMDYTAYTVSSSLVSVIIGLANYFLSSWRNQWQLRSIGQQSQKCISKWKTIAAGRICLYYVRGFDQSKKRQCCYETNIKHTTTFS